MPTTRKVSEKRLGNSHVVTTRIVGRTYDVCGVGAIGPMGASKSGGKNKRGVIKLAKGLRNSAIVFQVAVYHPFVTQQLRQLRMSISVLEHRRCTRSTSSH